jgi:glycolate oxidase FAD binding subunit
MLPTATIEDKLRSLVGAAHVRAATPDDSVAGRQPSLLVEPANEHELAAVLSSTNDAGLSVIPRGGGTKLSWGNPPARADILVSTARMNTVHEHAWADLTVAVEAGCTLQALQELLARHGQRLALDSLWPERATIGGLLSTNDSGSLRLRFGSLRDLIIGVTLALPDGTLASSGGKVVKNVAGYDLPKLCTGALGTLGVITRAIFRLHPLPHASKTISFETSSVSEVQEKLLAVQDSKLAHVALQLRASAGVPPQADVLLEATQAGIAAQEAQLRTILQLPIVQDSPAQVWNARQDLWSSPFQNAFIAKFSVLPADIEKTLQTMQSMAANQNCTWRTVIQATGIGCLRFEGSATSLRAACQEVRDELARHAGSLVILSQPSHDHPLEAWGSPGDAASLMRAVKFQLDPKGTLNPGRFVGGI